MLKSNPVLRNIIANYVTQIYVIVLGLAVVPMYLKYMGIEAYGLLGFFTMLQAWMTLLDFGLAPTLGREASRFKAGVSRLETVTMLLRLLEVFFAFIGLTIIVISSMMGSWIAQSWLKLHLLGIEEVTRCVVMVGVIVSLRLMSGVYRGGLFGLEQQVQANAITLTAATIRSLFVLPVLIWMSNSITTFFLFQLAAALLEILLLKLALHTTLPSTFFGAFDWQLVKGPMRFGVNLAFLSWVWIASSQIDKLLLSHILPMQEFGGFTLVTTVALGLYSLVSPLQQATLPRLTIFAEQNKRKEFSLLYRQTTCLTAAILAGIAGVMVAYSEQVLYTWTGDKAVAVQFGVILKWYVGGTAFLALAGLSYLMQNGDLSLHLKGSLLSIFIMIPAIVFFTMRYGVIGAAITWCSINLLFLLCWTTIVHSKFFPEIRLSWLVKDVFPAMGIASVFILLTHWFVWPMTSRLYSLIILTLLSLCVIMIAMITHIESKQVVKIYFNKFICYVLAYKSERF
jgi:O-antigen/teichoic acid export membrane protein